MGIIRPGGIGLTNEAIEKAGIKKGSRILEIGCGEGDTAAFLSKEWDMDVEGIDRSREMIRRADEKHPDLKLQFGEADFLEFPSLQFDAVLMECVFSLTYLKTEVFHEIYCVLKKGGKFIVTDLYNRDPDPDKVKAAMAEVAKALKTPKREGQCEERSIPPEYMLDRVFIKEELIRGADDNGFIVELWEDKSEALHSFVAEKILEYGSLCKYFEEAVPANEPMECFCAVPENSKNTGYFLLILKKPE